MTGLLLDAATIFFVVAWLLSAIAVSLPLPARPEDRAREAWRLALLPGMGGAVVVAVAFWPSLLTAWGGAPDHCGLEGAPQLHLCWLHGAMAPLAWHDGVIGGLAGVAALTVAWRLAVWAFAARRLASMRDLADASRGATVAAAASAAGVDVSHPVWVVPSDRPWCFVAGLVYPRVVVATAVVDVLGPADLAAALAHEAAHARRADHLRRLVVDVATIVHAPGFGRGARARWADAAERACDEEAAASLGSRVAVAEALVRFQRLINGAATTPVPAASFGGEGGLERRVRALLADAPPAGRSGWRAWPWVATATSAVSADGIHRGVEHLLGALHG